MYNMIGKTRLYTKLAAAARAKENGTDMVDFKALAAKNKAKQESSKPVEQEKKEPTMDTASSRKIFLITCWPSPATKILQNGKRISLAVFVNG